MKKSKDKETIKLRKQTEELLNNNLSDIKKISPDEVCNLLEDLQIYQIEIEMYNKQLKKVHEDLWESKEQYLSLVQNSIDGIAIVQELEIKCVNSALIKMLGYRNAEEIEGHNFTEFVSPGDRDFMLELGRDRENGKRISSRYEFRALRKDGLKFDAELSVSLIPYNGGVARQGIIRDITKKKQIKEALKASEKRFRSFLENLGDAAYEADASGNITYSNKIAETISGMPLKDIIGKPFLPLFTTESQKIAINVYQRTLNGESPEYELTFNNGSICHFKNEPLQDEDDEIVGVFGVARDITERKQAEEALRESESRYRAVVESQTEMICRFLPDGTLTFVNEAYCRYFKRNQDELIGHKFMPLIPESDQEKVLKNITSLDPKTPTIMHEHRVIDPNGKICWHKWTNRAIFDDQNTLKEYQAVGLDITERVHAEEALKKAYDVLEKRVQDRTQELNVKTNDLEELNAALKVLLDKREEDKIELQDNILSNVKILIEPYVDKLKRYSLPQGQKTLINILESNLNEIVSPFTRKLSSKLLNLSPSEIQVANLVKYGKTNKEIAELLHVAKRTIAFHRENIRKKLGINNQKANLKTYLMSLG